MLLKEEAEKLSLGKLQTGVLTEIVTTSGLFALLPVQVVNGKAFNYVREKTLGQAAWVGPGGKIKESTATTDEVSTSLKACIADADIPDQLEEFNSELQSPTAVQLRAKTKVVLREIQRILIKGNSTTNPLEPDGLQALVTGPMTVGAADDAANGGALKFKDLDRLKAKVKVGTPLFWLCNESTIIIVRELFRSKNIEPEDLALPNFRPDRKFLHYAGLPFIVEDNIAFDETKGTNTDCASIYLVAGDDAEGFTGLISKSGGGIRVKMIGTLHDKDADRIRVKMYFGTALRSTLAVARMSGVRDI